VRTETTAPGRAPASGWGALFYWAPLAVWLAAIFYFSTDAMSAEHTSRFIEPLIRRLLPDASPETVYVLHVGVRKLGHLAEYAVLGLLALRAVRSGRAEPFRPRWAAIAFAIAAGYALVDEYHQTFVRSRTGNLEDALVDMVGAAAALALYAWARRKR
jgi:VanZ family protein